MHGLNRQTCRTHRSYLGPRLGLCPMEHSLSSPVHLFCRSILLLRVPRTVLTAHTGAAVYSPELWALRAKSTPDPPLDPSTLLRAWHKVHREKLWDTPKLGITPSSLCQKPKSTPFHKSNGCFVVLLWFLLLSALYLSPGDAVSPTSCQVTFSVLPRSLTHALLLGGLPTAHSWSLPQACDSEPMLSHGTPESTVPPCCSPARKLVVPPETLTLGPEAPYMLTCLTQPPAPLSLLVTCLG